ncbi:MAG: cation-binding protein, partial [Chitinophagaceae bacterium]
MANELKPIKRSEQLVPLSKDHHDGLLLVWKIKQGLKNGTALTDIATYVNWFWQQHLHDHFQQEEQFLAPNLPQDNPMLLQMLDEHQEIKALIHINEQIGDEAL